MEDKKSLVTLQAADWDTLLPGQEYTLGQTKLKIVPLGLEDTGVLLKRLSELIELWGPILEEYGQGEFLTKQPKDKIAEVLPKMSEMISKYTPDILSLVSGVEEADIKRLPPAIALDLAVFCIGVNVKSLEGLEKNLASLVVSVTRMVQNQSLPGGLGKQSKH